MVKYFYTLLLSLNLIAAVGGSESNVVIDQSSLVRNFCSIQLADSQQIKRLTIDEDLASHLSDYLSHHYEIKGDMVTHEEALTRRIRHLLDTGKMYLKDAGIDSCAVVKVGVCDVPSSPYFYDQKVLLIEDVQRPGVKIKISLFKREKNLLKVLLFDFMDRLENIDTNWAKCLLIAIYLRNGRVSVPKSSQECAMLLHGKNTSFQKIQEAFDGCTIIFSGAGEGQKKANVVHSSWSDDDDKKQKIVNASFVHDI